MKNVIFCVLILFWWSLKQIEKLKSKHFENSEVMNEWMMHLYSAIVYCCTPKALYIMWGGGSLLNHHQCAASTWMMQRLPQDSGTSALQVERRESHRANQVDALATHQLQVQRRESHRPNQVDALPHKLQVERGERVIEPKVYALTTHLSYRWRGERVIETIKWMRVSHTPATGGEEREYNREANSSVGRSPPRQLQVERRESQKGQSSVCSAHHTPATWWRGEASP